MQKLLKNRQWTHLGIDIPLYFNGNNFGSVHAILDEEQEKKVKVDIQQKFEEDMQYAMAGK